MPTSLFPFPTVGTLLSGKMNIAAQLAPIQTNTLNFDGSFSLGSDGLGTTTVSVLPPTANSAVNTSDFVVTQRAGVLSKVTQGAFWTQTMQSQAISGGSGIPAVSLTIPRVSGQMASGAPQAKYFNFEIDNDTVDANGSPVAMLAGFTYGFGGAGQTGSRAGIIVQLNQKGPLAPIAGKNTVQPTVAGFYGKFNDTAGGTALTATSARGLAYSLNPKISLLSGALNWGMLNALGEINFSIEPASQVYQLTGTVNTGGTWSLRFASSAITGSPITLTDTAVTGDSLGMRVQRLASKIMRNDALQQAGIGVAIYGANSGANPNTYRLCWPAWVTDLVVTPTIAAGGGETVTVVGTPAVGASALKKHGMTFIASHNDGTAGFATDACIVFNKQSPDNAPSSGGWKVLCNIGGGIVPDDNGDDVVIGGWPMDPFGSVWMVQPPARGAGGGSDTPVAQCRMYTFADLRLADFSVSQGRPLQSPGFATFWDGATRIGALNITRVTGNATVNPGTLFSANGWECTGITIANGGGSSGPTDYSNRYYVDDLIPYMEGTLRVTSVSNTGAVTGLSVQSRPMADAGASPPTTGIDLSGASSTGDGLIINATWTKATLLSFQAGDTGQGLITTTASRHVFGANDGTPQLRVGNSPLSVEFWEAQGGQSTQGATLHANSDSSSNVDGAILAKGTGELYFGNGTGAFIEMKDPGGPIADWLTLTPMVVAGGVQRITLAAQSPTTSPINISAAGVSAGFGCTAAATTHAYGTNCSAFGTYSQARGRQAYVANGYGEDVWSNGAVNILGDCQERRGGILRGVTTSATAVRLTADGSGTPNGQNTVNLHNDQLSPENMTLSVTGEILCRNTSSNKTGRWSVKAILSRAGATATLEWLSIVRDYVDAGMAAIVDPTVILDNTNVGLNISPTGIAATTLNWQFRYTAGELG